MKPKNAPIGIRSDMGSIIRRVDAFSRQGVVLFDRSGQVLTANRRFAVRLGYQLEEVLGSSIDRFVRFGRPLEESRSDEQLSIDDKNYPYAALLLKKNGRTISVPYDSFPVIVNDVEAYLVFLADGDLPRTPSLLRRFSDTFMKDVNLGVLLIDLDYTVINVSDKACRILGYSREELMYRSVDDIFASVPEQHRLVQRTILDGVIVRNYAVSWTNRERRYDLLLDSNVLRDHRGRIVGAYVMFKDVTNLRSLEAQVQRSDRLAMIGQIAAGTAHEIRNPLTSIKGFLQILKSTFERQDMPKERSFTEVMLSEIDRINELVSEFLLLSKQKEALLSEVDVQSVLRGILPIIESEALLHNSEVRYEPLPSLPTVTADQEMLKQVFLNICKNGIEAMPDGGLLTITEKLDGDERKVLIDIHDNGPGIPLFLVDKIFDPFFTTKENGTGLGLSVCQRIIHDIGGTIRVSSKGYGTTFTVGIPFS
jgi:two-component system, sporulation sensor kinase E